MKTFSRDVCGALIFAAVVALLVLAATSAGWAQKDMGNIVGMVKDGTGAVVPDAKVVVTDVDHGTIFPTRTNSSGEYVAGPLRIGQEMRMNSLKSRAMNCGPLSEMIRGLASGYCSLGSFQNHLNLSFFHLKGGRSVLENAVLENA